jgi:dynein heavy chain
MDDNRLLTLSNGDRIRLLKHCLMLFEVDELKYASPATISRCGMVYVDPKNLGYAPYYARWLKAKNKDYGETIHDIFKDFLSKYIDPVIARIYDGVNGEDIDAPFRFITPRTNLNLVTQLCTLVDSILPDPEHEPTQDQGELEHLFLFCLTWSFGACIVDEDRKAFNDFVLLIYSQPGISNLYDYFFDAKKSSL